VIEAAGLESAVSLCANKTTCGYRPNWAITAIIKIRAEDTEELKRPVVKATAWGNFGGNRQILN
jgi:hypothetical protein